MDETDEWTGTDNNNNYLVFNPYNPLNVKITLDEVQCILSLYGISNHIRNIELYQRAFVHRSYTKRPNTENHTQHVRIADRPANCLPLSSKSNERLEFLGDGILELVTKFYLYRRFPKGDEGFMTEKKIAIVKNEAIGQIALEMGLHKWLVLSKHAEDKKIRTNLKKLGCLFEAFIGALFLDFNGCNPDDAKKQMSSCCGFQIAKTFLENIFERHIDWAALICNDDNYKNILQVKIQREFKVTPHYLLIRQDVDHGFCMGVYLCLKQEIFHLKHEDSIPIQQFLSFQSIHEYGKILVFLGAGQHKIKRKAEQIACNNALLALHPFQEIIL
jgi:dsRNA-specific ribonuclease